MTSWKVTKALRGVKEETFNLLSEALTTDGWAELLMAPLERAAAKGKRGLVQQLVAAGAEVGMALHEAVRADHQGIAKDLLDGGASTAAKDADGNTPLHLAASGGRSGMVQLLMLNGSDKDAMDRYECTPLYLAVHRGHMAAAVALLVAGADTRLSPVHGSVVHIAAYKGHVGILRALIEHGADVEAADFPRKETALHDAAKQNKIEAVDVLLAAGANIEARNHKGWTPLHGAAIYASRDTVVSLLKHGADVNAKDDHGETPLYWAAGIAGAEGSAEVVDVLLRSGADETVLNDEGESPADVVGTDFLRENTLGDEDLDRVCELLANAPTDRAWRRRGYLVMCRAYPDRMQQIQRSSSAPAGVARRTRSGAKLGRTEASAFTGTAGSSTAATKPSVGWVDVVATVLGMQEEGIFRAIIGFL